MITWLIAKVGLRNLKLIGIAAGAIALLWWHQHQLAKEYRRGATDRERSALIEAAAKVEQDTTARRLELDAREQDLQVRATGIQSERHTLNTARTNLDSTLKAGISQLNLQSLDIRNEIQTVPDDAVNGRFRLALERARSNERNLTIDTDGTGAIRVELGTNSR